MMEREALIEQGVAVYQVGDVFDTNEEGLPIPQEEKGKWFVSVLANSPLSAVTVTIPLAATEDEAWSLAARHYCGVVESIHSAGLAASQSNLPKS